MCCTGLETGTLVTHLFFRTLGPLLSNDDNPVIFQDSDGKDGNSGTVKQGVVCCARVLILDGKKLSAVEQTRQCCQTPQL